MIEKDTLGLIISLISAGIATYAAIISKIAVQRQLHATKWSTNQDLLTRAREMLISNPELLTLHSIDPNELANYGITCEELVYIMHHIGAGSTFHRISGDKEIELTPFRKKFFENQKVRLAWKKYLRDNYSNPWAYSKAIDNYIATLEE